MARRLSRVVLNNFGAFCDHFAIELFPWQREAFGQATDRRRHQFRYRLAGVSVPRGDGKSYAGAAVGLWRLLAGPAPQDVISPRRLTWTGRESFLSTPGASWPGIRSSTRRSRSPPRALRSQRPGAAGRSRRVSTPRLEVAIPHS